MPKLSIGGSEVWVHVTVGMDRLFIAGLCLHGINLFIGCFLELIFCQSLTQRQRKHPKTSDR